MISYNAIAHTWLQQALRLQHNIDLDVPLNQASFIGTHNTFNSKAYQIPFIRYVDPNQQLSIYDQLETGIRSIELDVHWTYDLSLQKNILLCHAQSNHLGCSLNDLPLANGLIELRRWLLNYPHELVLLYFERHLDNQESKLAALLEEYLGEFIYKPKAASNNTSHYCTALPKALTKHDVLQANKNLIIVTKGCIPTKENNVNDAFDLNDYVFSGIGEIPSIPHAFLDMTITHFPGPPYCERGTIFQADPEHTSLWRVYEDRTEIGKYSHFEKELTPIDMQHLILCGINWPTLDMLAKNDERLIAAIWSWAPQYPQLALGHCAYYKLGKGIINGACDDNNTSGFVCRNRDTRQLSLIKSPRPWQYGNMICELQIGKKWYFSLPQNGKEAKAIADEMALKGIDEVSLNYAYVAKKWRVHIG